MVESAFYLPVNTNAAPAVFSLLTPAVLVEVLDELLLLLELLEVEEFVPLVLLDLVPLVLLDEFDLVPLVVPLVELLEFALVPLVLLPPVVFVELVLVVLVVELDDDEAALEDVVAYFPVSFPLNLDPYNCAPMKLSLLDSDAELTSAAESVERIR